MLLVCCVGNCSMVECKFKTRVAVLVGWENDSQHATLDELCRIFHLYLVSLANAIWHCCRHCRCTLTTTQRTRVVLLQPRGETRTVKRVVTHACCGCCGCAAHVFQANGTIGTFFGLFVFDIFFLNLRYCW